MRKRVYIQLASVSLVIVVAVITLNWPESEPPKIDSRLGPLKAALLGSIDRLEHSGLQDNADTAGDKK